MTEFQAMLIEVRSNFQQKQFAESLGYSPQYQHDLEKGRRLPSVAYVNRLCESLGRGPKGRLAWHRAAAKAHGWEV